MIELGASMCWIFLYAHIFQSDSSFGSCTSASTTGSCVVPASASLGTIAHIPTSSVTTNNFREVKYSPRVLLDTIDFIPQEHGTLRKQRLPSCDLPLELCSGASLIMKGMHPEENTVGLAMALRHTSGWHLPDRQLIEDIDSVRSMNQQVRQKTNAVATRILPCGAWNFALLLTLETVLVSSIHPSKGFDGENELMAPIFLPRHPLLLNSTS